MGSERRPTDAPRGYEPRYDDYTTEEYPPDWDARRRLVLERDGYTCQGCGLRSTRVDDIPFDVDHVVPKSDGGSHAPENLQTLCPSCHAEKHPGNGELAQRARAFERRNRPSTLWRVLRVLLVVPLLVGGNDDGTVLDDRGRELELTPVDAVPELAPDEAVSVEARVVDRRSHGADSVGYKGTLAPVDPGGGASGHDPRVDFVVWADADLPALEPGTAYRVVGARTTEYRGAIELSLDRMTAVTRLE